MERKAAGGVPTAKQDPRRPSTAVYDQPVTMSFRAPKASEDYVAQTGTLTFTPGETTKTITIEVKGDSKKGVQRDVLPGPVRQQQQFAVHQEPRHRPDPERRLGNAAGWGWFVDPTPWNDSEFTTPGDQGEQNRMDLLTCLAHEVGHLLGQEHAEDGVMIDTLATGIRPLPGSTEVNDWSALLDVLVAEPLSKRRW